MAEAEPLLLYEHLKALDGPVVGVEHEHGQRRELGWVKTELYHIKSNNLFKLVVLCLG